MAREVTICAIGDIHYDREDAESMFAHVRPILHDADITFGQLEQNISTRGEPAPNIRAPLRAHPRVAAALAKIGFDIIGFNSNHTLDYGMNALNDTIDHVRANGMEILGAGRDIDEARKPVVFNKKGTKIGFLGYNSILPAGFEARPGRGGCAPIKVWTSYQPIEGVQPGTPCRILTFPNKEDFEAMKEDIAKLRPKVDVLVVSMHWGLHHVPKLLAMYQREVGHAAIDCGADLILGHHSHILKPIEVYKGKVIFYSLANFATEIPLPTMMEWLAHPEMKATWGVYDRVMDPEYPTYPFHPEAKMTIIARITITDGQISRVAFLPTIINKKAEPEVVKADDKRFGEIVRYMRKIDKSQGIETKYKVEGDEVVVVTGREKRRD